MERDAIINNMTILPHLNAVEAADIAEQLISAAQSEEHIFQSCGRLFPRLISRPLGRLRKALAEFKAVIPPDAENDSVEKRVTAYDLNTAWRLLYNWIDALAGACASILPGSDAMRALKKSVFNNARRSIPISHCEIWSQSESRLRAIENSALETAIDDMGGGPLLDAVITAHNEYGRVLAITSPLPLQTSSEKHAAARTLITSLEMYILKTIAYADPDESDSEALASTLLVPFEKWEERDYAQEEKGTWIAV